MRDLVVNVAHLADAFEPVLGSGEAYGVTLAYSREGDHADDALETLGGIVRALPLLGSDPFVVVSGDIVTDFDYSTLAVIGARLAAGAADAHLVLVDNPAFHAHGDMGLVDGLIAPDAPQRLHVRQHRSLRAAAVCGPGSSPCAAVSVALLPQHARGVSPASTTQAAGTTSARRPSLRALMRNSGVAEAAGPRP